MARDEGPTDDAVISVLADWADRYKAKTGESPLDLATPAERRDIDAARTRHHERPRGGALPRSTPDTRSTTMGLADDAAATLQQAFSQIHEKAVPALIAARGELDGAAGLLSTAGDKYASQWGGYLTQLGQNVEQIAGQANDLSNEIDVEAARLRQGA